MQNSKMPTRAQQKATFASLFKDVLQIEDDDPLTKCLAAENINSVLDLLSLSKNAIDNLKYQNSSNVSTQLPVHEAAKLHILKAWNRYFLDKDQVNTVDWDDRSTVNDASFLEFRVGIYDPDLPPPPRNLTQNTRTNTTNPITSKHSLASEFRKSMKRDKNHYKILSDEKIWDEWKRQTLATIDAHNCENIVNPSYIPSDQESKNLFKEQNKFMYDVFISILRTSMGKFFVRKHEENRNAQLVWSDYTEHMKSSVCGDMKIEKIMSQLTSNRLSPNFRGTTLQFIIDWIDKMRIFEEMTPQSSHWPNTMKKTLLQNAVSDLPVFQNIKTTEKIEIAKGRGPILYHNYVELLQNVAAQYDESLTATKRSNRIVNIHNLNDDLIYEYEDDEILPDERASSELFFEVNQTNSKQQFRRRPSLARDTWNKLSRKDQTAWDTISDFGKWDIIKDLRRAPQSQSNSTDKGTSRPISNVTASTASTSLLTGDEHLDTISEDKVDAPEQNLLVNSSATSTLNPGDIQRVLSKSLSKDNKTIKINLTQYLISRHDYAHNGNSLIDRGANGGLAGRNVRIIERTDRKVDVSGIDGHELKNLDIVTAGGVVRTQRGDVIVIMHQYAYVPNGNTIHSCVQLESFENKVDDKSIVLKQGKQAITTLEGYVIALDFINGLAYMPIRPFSNHDWDTLPHVVLTSDIEWDPATINKTISADQNWHDSIPNTTGNFDFNDFNTRGLYMINDRITVPSIKDFEKYRKYFLHVPVTTIQKTFQATTQFANSGWITGHIRNTYKSPFPALNVHRRNEDVATDTIYSNVPAVDNGSTCAQLYVGTTSFFCDVFGIKTDGQFVNTLLDVIKTRGAMDKLISDRAQAEISSKVKNILRHLFIKDWQSEPHYQHQNASERRYRNVKHNMQRIMNTFGVPPQFWLLVLEYVCFIMNRTALASLNWRTPFEKLTGSTPDISMIYRFKFYDRIYYKHDESRGEDFPSTSNEKAGRFVGFSENVGHAMTYKIWTEDTSKIIYRSRIKLASIEPNLLLDQSENSDNDSNTQLIDDSTPLAPPTHNTLTPIDTGDLIGRTYLTDPNEDGTRRRIKIVEQLDVFDSTAANNPAMIRFRAMTDDGVIEDIRTYSQLIDRIESEDGSNDEWHFRSIINHHGPIKRNDSQYKGSSYNLLIDWENGEQTWEPLSIIARSDPISCAIYAKDNDLLHLPGWTRFRNIANQQDRLVRLVNQAKLKFFRTLPVYKFGVQVPRNHNEAMELDRINGDTKWIEAERKELDQIDEYKTFTDCGIGTVPDGHKKIKVHMVYDIKPDLRRKARLVADGHLTSTPTHSVYSSVVSLRGLKIVIFIGELNNLPVWTTDVGNAYLEAFTKERVYIVAGHEFAERTGHTLIITKALYGLKSSGLMWWERFSTILREMNFAPSKAEDDIWMRRKGTYYEYVARYVDDLAIASKHPENIIDELVKVHKLKLKGSGPITYHLGANFFRDEDNVLCMSPTKYIIRMVDNYQRIFGVKPKTTYTSPLESGDHPELDTSEELGMSDIQKYQSLIGSLQWVISLGRMDIAVAVMTLSSFRVAPRKGHMDRVKRIYGYLHKMKDAAIRFRTGCPDYTSLNHIEHDWEDSVYSGAREIVPDDCPEPLGLPVIMTTYVDANLCHDHISGKAVTGVIHLCNQTVIDYYTRKQPLVETATYGSEFMAARTATEQIIDLRASLRYLGVNLVGPTYMFGDNKTVVDSASIPKSRIHKRHVLLSFHRVREAIAAKIIRFFFIPGSINPADIMTKHWGYQQIRNQLRAILFYTGDTALMK